jgi:hypothetical protein
MSMRDVPSKVYAHVCQVHFMSDKVSLCKCLDTSDAACKEVTVVASNRPCYDILHWLCAPHSETLPLRHMLLVLNAGKVAAHCKKEKNYCFRNRVACRSILIKRFCLITRFRVEPSCVRSCAPVDISCLMCLLPCMHISDVAGLRNTSCAPRHVFSRT